MNRHVLSRAFWLLGGKEARGEKPREESGQLVYKPGGHTWKGASRGESTESEEPRTSPEDTRDRG